jgi:hypothetical protein
MLIQKISLRFLLLLIEQNACSDCSSVEISTFGALMLQKATWREYFIVFIASRSIGATIRGKIEFVGSVPVGSISKIVLLHLFEHIGT